MIDGRCQCGSIRYEISSVPFNCCYCHCSICRRLTGSVVGAYGTVAVGDFKWIAGSTYITVYEQNDDSKRSFCSKCGSFLLSTHRLDPENVFLSLGCLDAHEGINIEYQQFTDSKAGWYSLDPKIKLYRTWPKWALERAKVMRSKYPNLDSLVFDAAGISHPPKGNLPKK